MAKRSFPFKRLGRDAVFTVIFCIGCALLITAVIGSMRDFVPNLIVSFCIGGTAFLAIDGVRLFVWDEHETPNLFALLAIILVSVPVSHFGGNLLASRILGFDTPGLTAYFRGQINGMMLFTLLVTCVAVLFFANRERLVRAEAAAAQERARALQAQLQLLQAQIEPHMLFNTLANLQGMIAIDPDGAQKMLDQLIQYLRATLNSSRVERTTLVQEFALLEAYLGLMSVRMGARLAYTLDLPDLLRKASIPPMLLQPLVENAIIHGLEPKIDGGHITVSAAQDGATLVLCVADTGLGLDAPSAKSGTHIGVANTRERLLALFGKEASFNLGPNAPQGALARLTLPATLP
ncbi:MAG: histidine kinase [Pseudomonadota bacterium]